MSERYQEPGLAKSVSLGLVGVLVINLCMALGRWQADAEGKVKRAQHYNEQLHDQLHNDRSVHGLLVDLDDNSFTFQTTDPISEHPETCTGKYEVKQDVAHVVGPLSCTQVVPQPAYT